MAKNKKITDIFKPASITKLSKAGLWRAFRWIFGLGVVAGLLGLFVVTIIIIVWTRDLPTVDELAQYRPAQMTRVRLCAQGRVATYYRVLSATRCTG